MATIYYTGCSLDGFIATSDHSLDWLTSRDIDPDGPMAYPGFRERIGAGVMGANTWQWILDHDEEPWGPLPTWVMTHRDFAPVEGRSVTFTSDDAVAVHAAAAEAAGGRDIWLVGGGELVGQFHDAGLLDEVWVQFAPATLGGGSPVLPRPVDPAPRGGHAQPRLRLHALQRRTDLVGLLTRGGSLAGCSRSGCSPCALPGRFIKVCR